jgi:nucleotide-binding universal stress UspA family protein
LQDEWDKHLALAGDYLQGVAIRLRAEGFAVDCHIMEDDPADAIVTYAEEEPGVTVIAMATHGRSGIRRWVFGSVAERVLHVATKPLLLVRPHNNAHDSALAKEEVAYRNILVPLDGSDFAEQALGWAQAAAGYEASLLLVSVLTGLDASESEQPQGSRWVDAPLHSRADYLSEYLTETARRLGVSGVRAQPYIRQGRPAEMILAAAAESHADLIVMSTHGRTGLERLWLGSVAAGVVKGATIPVLLVRPQKVQEDQKERSDTQLTGAGVR